MAARRARGLGVVDGHGYAASVLAETRYVYTSEWNGLKAESITWAGRVGALARDTVNEVTSFVGTEGDYFLRWVGEQAGNASPFLGAVDALIPGGGGVAGVIEGVASALLAGAETLLEDSSRSVTVQKATTRWAEVLKAAMIAQGERTESVVAMGLAAFEEFGSIGGQLEAIMAPEMADLAVLPPASVARRLDQDLAGGHDLDETRLDDLDAEMERRVTAADGLAHGTLTLISTYKARLARLEGAMAKLAAERARRWDELRAQYSRGLLGSGFVDLRVMLITRPGGRATLKLNRLVYPDAISPGMRAFLANRTVAQLCDDSGAAVMLRVEGPNAGINLKPGAPPEIVQEPDAAAMARLGLGSRDAADLASSLAEPVRAKRLRELDGGEVRL